jgi:DNA-binding transcriptional MerR regulator
MWVVAEVAKKFGVSRQRVSYLAKTKKIGQKLGGTYIFTERDIDELSKYTGNRRDMGEVSYSVATGLDDNEESN